MAGVTATYNGSYARGYLQYLDLGNNGQTLVAEPGDTYTIAIASGWEALAAIPADGFWQAAAAPSSVTLTAVPGAAEPGAFYPGSPGPAGDMAILEDRGEDEEWADRVMASAADPVYGENRDRLARAGEQLVALRRRQLPG